MSVNNMDVTTFNLLLKEWETVEPLLGTNRDEDPLQLIEDMIDGIICKGLVENLNVSLNFLSSFVPKLMSVTRSKTERSLYININGLLTKVIQLTTQTLPSKSESLGIIVDIFKRDAFYELKREENLPPEDGDFANSVNKKNLSVFLYKHINTFGTMGGFDKMIELLKSTQKVPVIKLCQDLLISVRDYLKPKPLKKYSELYQKTLSEVLDGLGEEELKAFSKSDMEEFVYGITKLYLASSYQPDQVSQVTDQLYLSFATKCFKSNFLEKKLNGLEYIEDLILEYRKREYNESDNLQSWGLSGLLPAKMTQWMKKWNPKSLKNWIKQMRVVEELFDKKNTRDQLIKKGRVVLHYLAIDDEITKEHMISIWDTTDDKYLCAATFEVLTYILISLNPVHLSFIWKKLEQTQSEEWTKERIYFTYNVCRKLLSHPKHKNLLEIPGSLQIFWRVMSDTSKAPREVINMSQKYYLELMMEHNFLNLKKISFYHKLVENIEKDQEVLQTINFLQALIKKFRQLRVTRGMFEQQDDEVATKESLVKKLDTLWDLYKLLVNDLCRYKKKVSPMIDEELKKNPKAIVNDCYFCGRFKHYESFQIRFEFLLYIMKKRRHSGKYLSKELIDLIWNYFCLSKDASLTILPSEREFCLGWLKEIGLRVLQENTPLVSHQVIEYIFTNLLTTLDKEHITGKEYSCFRTYLCAINIKPEGPLKMIDDEGAEFKVISLAKVQGIEELWDVVKNVKNETSFKLAANFLIKLYTQYPDKLRSVMEENYVVFLTDCFSIILDHTSKKEPLTPKQTRELNHAIELLKLFLDKTKHNKIGENKEQSSPSTSNELSPPTEIEKAKSKQLREVCSDLSEIGALLAIRKFRSVEDAVTAIFSDSKFKTELETQEQSYRLQNSKKMISDITKDQITTTTAIIAENKQYFEALLHLLEMKDIHFDVVWKIIESLPPNKDLQDTFRQVEKVNPEDWDKLLDYTSLFKLQYSLQMVYSFILPELPPDLYNKDSILEEAGRWSESFSKKGGFKHIYMLVQQKKINQQLPAYKSCMSYLLKIIYHYMKSLFKEVDKDNLSESQRIAMNIISEMDVIEFTHILISLLWNLANETNAQEGKETYQIIEYSMLLLVNLIISNPAILNEFYNYKIEDHDMKHLIKYFLTECADSDIRRRCVQGFHDLCSKFPMSRKDTTYPTDYFLGELLSIYPFGNESKWSEEYFSFLTQLISLKLKNFPETHESFYPFIKSVISEIHSRPGDKTELSKDRDVILWGSFKLLSTFFRIVPSLKEQDMGTELVDEIFYYCVYVPDRPQKLKCLTDLTRQEAFCLLKELTTNSDSNYKKLIHHIQPFCGSVSEEEKKHRQDLSRTQRREEFVGLHNLGCTCYANAIIQQFFMIPELRCSVFNTKLKDNPDHLLPLLLKMFSNLQESERRFYDPTEFMLKWATRANINIAQQQDAEEFYNLLTERIEEELKALNEGSDPESKTNGKNLIHLFKGQLHREICCSTEAQHRSEGFEDITSLTVEIDKKKNLQEALVGFFEGEKIQDFKCPECQKQVEVTKSFSLKSLPETLIIVLKRFRFNASTLHREKICDRFEYPMQLDMKKYMSTKSDLVDEESCLYKLSGVVVHSGMVDAGHYYSFIKERNSLKEKWYRFDDRSITDFNPNDLPVETFGGDKTSSWYDPTTDPYRTRNVYMLFYEREKTKTPEEIGNGLQILKDSVPKDLLQSIRQENTSLLHERLHFDPYFLVFLREVVENLSVTETSECPEDDFVLQTLKHATNLFFETIVIERNEQSCLHWIDILSRHYLLHLPACKWILNTLCTTKTNWFCSYFLESNDTWLRESLKHFLETVLSVVSIREDHLLLDYCVSLPPQLDGVIPFEKWSNYDLQKLFLYTSNIAPEHVEKLKPYNVSDVHGWYKKNEISLKIEEIGLPQEISLKIQEGIKNALNKVEPKQIPTIPTLAKFTTYLFRIMEDTRNHWRRFQQYWSLLDFLTTKCGDTEKHYILEHHKLVTRLLDYYMGPYTLYKREDERVTLGVKGVTVDLSSFFWLLSHAICSCNNFAMQSGSRSFDMPPTLLTSYPSPLFNHDVEFLTNNELMGSFIRQCYNVNAIREMIKHLSWEDTEKSIYLLAAIQEFHAKIDTNSYIILLRSILELEDSLQPLRISILLTNKGKGLLHSSFFKEADEKAFQLLKLFLDLGKAKPLVASWLKKNGTLEQILIRYDDLFMRKRRESYKTFKIELLQTLEENNTPFPPISSPYEEIPSWTQ